MVAGEAHWVDAQLDSYPARDDEPDPLVDSERRMPDAHSGALGSVGHTLGLGLVRIGNPGQSQPDAAARGSDAVYFEAMPLGAAAEAP